MGELREKRKGGFAEGVEAEEEVEKRVAGVFQANYGVWG